MNINKYFVKRYAAAFCGILGILLVFVSVYLTSVFVSCKITPDGISIVTGDFTAPELKRFSAESGNELVVNFSEEVRITDALITAEIDGTVFAGIEIPDGLSQTQHLVLSQQMTAGQKYRVSGIAEDRKGNSLSFSVGFSGYNSRVPALVLSEVRSEYSKPKVEFIELYAVTAGNLAGVMLMSAYDGADCMYEFAPCEVAAGEYIVLHYRKLDDGSAYADETGSNLALSGGTDSSGSRDFWVNNTSARIGKSDVILLRERAGGRLLDALLYSESSKSAWKDDTLRKAAEEAAQAGLWESGDTASAVVSDKMTVTRTMGRQNIPQIAATRSYSGAANGKAVWMVTASSSASPGSPNSSAPAQ
ncbi:MAG: hypothetical protein Pg6C_13330 [Treponemataceae bacterium]|nr:MAG: hypothetical protein Pg6C_13330 [Treponemataceae bacterium]